MGKNRQRAKAFLLAALLWVAPCMPVHGGNSIEAAGEVLTLLLPATAAGMTVGFKDKEGAIQLGKSGALTLGVTYGIKYALDETAPNGDKYSFPSAHTSVSFTSAEFMRARYGWEYGIPAYVAATFVAVSRVEARDHYVHDVIAGAAIGVISSYIFTRPYKGLHVQPDVGRDYYGIRLSRVW